MSATLDLATPKVFRWDDLPKETVTDLLSRKIITGEKVMIAHIWLAKGCVVPLHSHEAEQISYTFSGALKFIIEGETFVTGPGELLVIPSRVPHEAVALEDTYEMDIFSPIRHDWLDRTDAYFKNAPTQPAGYDRPATGGNPAKMIRWDDVTVEAVTEHIDRAYVSGDRSTFCDFLLRRGAIVPTHQHEAEQITWVRTGHLRFQIGGEAFEVAAGSVVRIPSNVPHSATALEDSKVMDFFSPRRDDWIAQRDSYLRQGNR